MMTGIPALFALTITGTISREPLGVMQRTLTFRSIHEWDVCGGVLLVEEAGGTVVDGSGKQLMFNRQEIRHRGVVAANTQLAQGLQGLWSKAMAEKV